MTVTRGTTRSCYHATMPRIAHLALLVRDHDGAIAFYRDILGFTLVEDTLMPDQAKRWVTIRPPTRQPTAPSRSFLTSTAIAGI